MEDRGGEELTRVGLGRNFGVLLVVAAARGGGTASGSGSGRRLGFGLLNRGSVGRLEQVARNHGARENQRGENHGHRREGDEEGPREKQHG